MNDILRFGLVLSLLLGLSGCAAWASRLPRAASGGELVRSDKPRASSPSAAPADVDQLAAGNRSFALALYRTMRTRPGNLFYSPYSISLALAMTYAGARGETAQQMAQALHFTLPPDRLHPAFNRLDLELARRGEGAKGKEGKAFQLNIVNALWGQTGYKFLVEFLNVLAEDYGAGMRLLDFRQAPEPSRATINSWVDDQTQGRIKDLIPQGEIDALTRLVLTNAIYMNAAWSSPFDKGATSDGPFHLLDGRQVAVPLMKQTGSFRYAEGNGYQAVELPYDGNKLAMLVVLPRAGPFEAFEGAWDTAALDAAVKALAPRQVALTMPRFKYDSSVKLNDALSDLSMRDAFDAQRADFSGMDGTRDLYIGAVLHKAFVAVDEAGTEAAAATAVVMRLTAMPAEPVTVTIDRPFVFAIRDIETGTLLFVGRVVNPAQ